MGGGGVRLLMMEILIVRSSNEFDALDYSAVTAMCPVLAENLVAGPPADDAELPQAPLGRTLKGG